MACISLPRCRETRLSDAVSSTASAPLSALSRICSTRSWSKPGVDAAEDDRVLAAARGGGLDFGDGKGGDRRGGSAVRPTAAGAPGLGDCAEAGPGPRVGVGQAREMVTRYRYRVPAPGGQEVRQGCRGRGGDASDAAPFHWSV